jgi:hypothetical protein
MASRRTLTAFALNCSLKSSNDEEKSSTDRLLGDLIAALGKYGVGTLE